MSGKCYIANYTDKNIPRYSMIYLLPMSFHFVKNNMLFFTSKLGFDWIDSQWIYRRNGCMRIEYISVSFYHWVEISGSDSIRLLQPPLDYSTFPVRSRSRIIRALGPCLLVSLPSQLSRQPAHHYSFCKRL